MRRGPVILLSAVVALVAAVLGLLAWRADESASGAGASSTAVLSTATPSSAATPSPTAEVVVEAATAPNDSLVAGTPVPIVAPSSTASAPTPTADAEAPSSSSATSAVVVDGPAVECPSTAHGAIVDRASQRAWLCGDGAIVTALPITSAWSMPDPGTYPVYAKDLKATSTFGGHFSRMTHFVAFTYGRRTGARIAFHSVPTLGDGTFVQTLDSVGQLDLRGESSGCIRVLPDDAVRIWDWLSIGDEVHVIS